MSQERFYAQYGDCTPPEWNAVPAEAVRPVVTISEERCPGCMFLSAAWLMGPMEAAGLRKHASDELHFFLGGSWENPEPLDGEIEFQIENDVLTLTDTCLVFVPAGAAHGNIKVKSLNRPVMHVMCHMNAGTYTWESAQATAPKGTYANHKVERYEPVDGKLPEAPEGFLKLLLWLDGAKLKGAPYTEAVWFLTSNDTGPETHVHSNLDEFIGFLGSDPEHPEELGATVQFLLDGEFITTTKPCIIYVARNHEHSPILVPELHRPIYHFSGGNGGDYAKEANSTFAK